MATYTKVNLKSDVEDMAPKFGLGDGLESHFAREPLGLEHSGLSMYRVKPGFRLPFGHHHAEQEEVYLVAEGSARMKIGDDIVDLAQWDAVRVPPRVMRAFEGGDDGAVLLAFGAPTENNADAEVAQNWWSD